MNSGNLKPMGPFPEWNEFYSLPSCLGEKGNNVLLVCGIIYLEITILSTDVLWKSSNTFLIEGFFHFCFDDAKSVIILSLHYLHSSSCNPTACKPCQLRDGIRQPVCLERDLTTDKP